ncbi:MAG TPA: trehalose-phosphatase [Thermoanaerobaculia bacterium]|nr:trehalose-phosphatase [Thermoanaerobaculia bacterium]
MQILRTGRDLETFFRSVARHSGQPLLLLDYDGTLAPFQKDRDKAVPYPGVVDALTALQEVGRTRLVIVSGRSVQDIPRLLHLNPLPEIWGSHGWERQLSDGKYSIAGLSPEARQGLEAAYAAVQETGGADHCERKPASLALHWRGLNPALVESYKPATIDRWTAISLEYGLELHSFDGGVELRVPGRDKGFAVRSLLAEMGAETPTAYLGDDATDEDAFAAVGSAGLGVLVRPEYRATRADVWLRPPEELLSFLHSWRVADELR